MKASTGWLVGSLKENGGSSSPISFAMVTSEPLSSSYIPCTRNYEDCRLSALDPLSSETGRGRQVLDEGKGCIQLFCSCMERGG